MRAFALSGAQDDSRDVANHSWMDIVTILDKYITVPYSNSVLKLAGICSPNSLEQPRLWFRVIGPVITGPVITAVITCNYRRPFRITCNPYSTSPPHTTNSHLSLLALTPPPRRGARGDERTCYVALIVSPVATPTAAASTGTSIKHGCAATAVIITAAAPH